MNKLTISLGFTLIFYAAGLIGVQTFVVMLKFWDPFYYHSVTVITPEVKPGGTFIEELDIQRFRICKVEVDRFLVNDETGEVMYRERLPGGATKLGRSITRNSFQVPLDAHLGSATLLQNVHSDCMDGMHSMPWPVLHFEVVG